ncbi:MAG: hypothetical protein K2L59_05455 [Muribaculaceae bacterium]|nr:hypothetical protein [Muribaculaceae bacterium]
MKDNDKNNISDTVGGDTPFKGYTMEELRYQRAMMALRKEFCKAKVQQSARRLRPGSDRKQKAGSGSGLALAGRVASTLFSHMNTMDYILMGISLFGTAKKGYRLIRGKK